MSMTDPIADCLTRIRNGLAIRREAVEIPYSKMKDSIVRLLQREGYVKDVRVVDDVRVPFLRVYLKYGPDREDVIQRIEKVSRPGRRVYKNAKAIEPVLEGLGVGVFSTSQGILSDKECRERNIGGEYVCRVF